MISLDGRIVAATSYGAKQLALRLSVSHEPMIAASNRQIFKSLHEWVMSSDFIVMVIEVLDYGILLIGI